jgi:hypothetical protein
MQIARRMVEMRRLVPDAFDENGVMIPDQGGRAWRLWIESRRAAPEASDA